MEERRLRKKLKKQMGISGWALLLYQLIMNICVIAVVAIDVVRLTIWDGRPSEEELMQVITANAWGYLIASAIAFVLILLWKKKRFVFCEIWVKENTMTFGRFWMILFLFLGAQGLFQLLAMLIEWLFNLFGLSVLTSIDAASGVPDTLSMFLYVGLAAPIMEEIIFRGLLLRIMQPFGKRFAILTSAFLFGIFHGNIVQTPYAFMVGLVLGYVAVEYSIGWAMVLHMINNLILGDTFSRVAQLLPADIGDMLFGILIWGSLIAAVIILVCKRRDISAYRAENPIHPWCPRAFFGSAGIICLSVVMGLIMLMGITML